MSSLTVARLTTFAGTCALQLWISSVSVSEFMIEEKLSHEASWRGRPQFLLSLFGGKSELYVIYVIHTPHGWRRDPYLGNKYKKINICVVFFCEKAKTTVSFC